MYYPGLKHIPKHLCLMIPKPEINNATSASEVAMCYVTGKMPNLIDRNLNFCCLDPLFQLLQSPCCVS